MGVQSAPPQLLPHSQGPDLEDTEVWGSGAHAASLEVHLPGVFGHKGQSAGTAWLWR